MKIKDKIYKSELNNIKPFSFDRETAEVFDDMLDRSIPWYGELQRFIALLSDRFYVDDTEYYDLGCSTGNTILAVNNYSSRNFNFTAVDYSPFMIEKSRINCKDIKVNWVCDSIENIDFRRTSVVNMAYVLQFVKPENRIRILENIYDNLVDGGILIICEKTVDINEKLESSYVDLYHDFKLRNGYSKLEIDQKSRALKDILIPDSIEKINENLTETGFSHVSTIMKYLNFTCMVAIK